MGNRLFWIAFLFLLLAHLVPMVLLELYPLIDLPYHLAAATIYRHIGEAGNDLAEYYRVDILPRPNTFHLLFCGTLFPSVEVANKIFLCLYVLLLPLSVLLLIKRVGGNRWFALLSFLLLYNYSVSWGFVGFAMAIPFVLFAHCLTLDCRAGTAGVGKHLLLALLLIVLFSMHVLGSLLALVLLGAAIVTRKRASPALLLRALLVALPLIAIVVWWRISARAEGASDLLGFLGQYYGAEFFRTFYRRGALLLWDNFALYGDPRGFPLAALFALAIIVLAVRWRRARPADSAAATPRPPLAPAGLLLLVGLLFYLLVPFGIPGTSHLYERFAVFVLLGFILLGAIVWAGQKCAFRKIAITGLCLLHFGLWGIYYLDFHRETDSFDASIFPTETRGTTLAALIFDYNFRDRPVFLHFQEYYVVWRQGIVTTKMVDYQYHAIRRVKSEDQLPEYNEWIGKYRDYDDRYREIDYLLTRGEAPPEASELLSGFGLMHSRDLWSLYQRAPE